LDRRINYIKKWKNNMEINVGWSDIKAFITARNVPLQYFQTNNTYYLFAADGPMEIMAQIPMDGSDTTDQTDFETNYKANANGSPRPNVVQVLGADSLTLTPFGAFSGTTLQANSTTNWDIAMPQTMVLKGAEFFSSNATLGDWLSVFVIDKDNVTGQGGTPDNPTVLGQYAISWFIVPGLFNRVEDVSISESLMQGLYLRFAYTSTSSTVAPTAIVNFISYVGTP
jgi:hypothetical protein